MKAVKADLPQDIDILELHTFADWHIGDKHCDLTAIKEQVAAVQRNDNAYAICNGDLLNNATKASVSDCYSEEIPPMEQIERLVSILTPVKDKILLLTQGNHESRTYRQDGIDLTALVAKQLGIYDKYVREGGVLFVRFGTPNDKHGRDAKKMRYTVYATHGSGGGRKEGSKAIRLADMASIVDCDIYIHSHTHLPMIIKQGFHRLDVCNSSVQHVEKLFVNTSAQLSYGGYGQTFEFKANSMANPVIYMNGKRKEFTARL